jgi:membrane protein YqaA with SNARE-associated domain
MLKGKRIIIFRYAIAFLLAASAIAIASLTVGRDIYYGSRDQGLLSFAIVNAAGYLFFLFMPVEIAFIYYLEGDINIIALNAVALGTALFSQAVDYAIGLLLSDRIIDNLIGRHQYEKAEGRLRRYGNIAILLFNALPLSSDVIALAAGMLRHRKRDAFIFTLSGLVIKYTLLSIIFG